MKECPGRIPRLIPAEELAHQLTANTPDRPGKFADITSWVNHNIVYDYIKAMKVAKVKGVKPDPVACFASHKGICQDVAMLTAIMMRAVGIRCYVCIGHANQSYHAWVQAYIGGKVFRYDHSNQAGKAIKYTVERVIK